MSAANPYQPVGTLGGESYVEREADVLLRRAVIEDKIFPYMLAARQSGKSSALLHLKKSLESTDIRITLVDLSSFPAADLANERRFVTYLILSLAQALGLSRVVGQDLLEGRREPGFFRRSLRLILSSMRGRLIICLDEIDALLKCRFKDAFLSSIRAFYNARAEDELFRRLQFVLAGATSVENLISNPNVSPFNVGTSIELGPFDLGRTIQLVQLGWPRAKGEWQSAASELMRWTSGSPFLIQHILFRAFESGSRATDKRDLVEIVEHAIRDTIRDAPEQIHFRNIYKLVAGDQGLLSAWVEWRKNGVIDRLYVERLCISGLSSRSRPIVCRIYEEVFGPSGAMRIGPPAPVSLAYNPLAGRRKISVSSEVGAHTALIEPFLTEDDFEDIRWYLEDYLDLPDGGAIVRARRIEERLNLWGHRLYEDLFSSGEAQSLIRETLAGPRPCSLTIATRDPVLLRIPWELMADSAGSLAQRISVRRQLERPETTSPRPAQMPLRMLYIVSRPADAGFIDPRLTTKALFDALDPLGASVRVDFCRPPTLARMEEMLRDGQRNGDPYDIVHFDGHGTFLPQLQVGALCFERPDEGFGVSATDLVPADRLGDLLASFTVSLVVLEACRSPTVGRTSVFRSVAPRLIQAGVGSVLSMGYAMHVEAARLFFDRFYRELLHGGTIGWAVTEARKALRSNPARWIEGGPSWCAIDLLDWFVPHLYQREEDVALIPPDVVRQQSRPQFDVFLSTNHSDSARIELLARLLSERYNLRVWLDKWECGPGKLEPQCAKGIENSRFTVVAGSQAALQSKWLQWEIEQHLTFRPEGDRLIPIKLEDFDIPPELSEVLWVDFTDPAQDGEAIAHLARLIQSTDVEDARRRRGFRSPATRGEPGAFPPPPQYGFQGRARELYELERQFRTQRGIVLHAMGGMGKTALATEAAHWWTRSGLFRDGACFLSFEQFASADRAVQVLGTYLAGPRFEQLPTVEQRRRAVELFQQNDVLMVWDNFESVLPQFNDGATASGSPYTEEERRRIAELFHDLTTGPGRGCLLVTCRPEDTGLPGARRYELQGLARTDSLWLLSRILRRDGLTLADPRLSRDRLDPLLLDLADHPLSLELVGPHLRTRTPEAIRGDFGQLLAMLQQEAPEGRNQSLLASLEFSRRNLSPAARKALPWLGLFSGGVFEDNLLDLSQLAPESWEPIRSELQGIALLRVEDDLQIAGRPFLRFHPTLASAAADPTLAQNSEVRQRFIGVYGALMQALNKALTGSQSRAALEILNREEANYRTAVQWAVADQQLRAAAALGNTFRTYLERSGRLRERDSWVQWLREAVGQQGFTEEAAEYERQHAWTRFTQGDSQGAVDQLQNLIEHLRHTTEFDSVFQLALAAQMHGRVLDRAGASAQAIPILQEAVGLSETLVEKAVGQTWEKLLVPPDSAKAALQLDNLSAVMGDLANALSDAGQHDEALLIAERALGISEMRGNRREVAAAEDRCARILMASGRYDEADARYDLALSAAHQAGDKGLEGIVFQHQGSLADERNQLERASRLYQQALQRFQEAGDHRALIQIYNLLGVAEWKASRLAEARAWYEKSRELALQLMDRVGLGHAAHNIGIVYQAEGEAARKRGDESNARRRFEEARRSLEEGLEISKALGNKPNEAGSQSQLAQIYLHLGDLVAAESHVHEARHIREALGLKEAWRDYSTLFEISQARGDLTAAAEWAKKRDDLLAELRRRAGGGGGLPTEMLKALQALTIACAQAGFGDGSLGPDEEEALAYLEGLEAPFLAFVVFLRQLAAGQPGPIPSSLPAELQEWLEGLMEDAS